MKNILILMVAGVVAICGLCLLVQSNVGVENPIEEVAVKVSGFKGLLSPSEFEEKISDADSLVLDVRTLGEYQEQRITEDATLIDFYADNFKQQLSTLDKNKNYLIYCRSGNRSGQTIKIMEDLGFKTFYELEGGINAWGQSGLTVISG